MPVAILLAAFVAALAMDYAEVGHTDAVRRRDAAAAGGWALAHYVIGALGLLAMVEVGWWVVVPEALGFCAGSYLAVRRLA